eukprot:GHRR01025247.1.p1 GENE.GHRR01025247.1~~GHRR01025247.1.p1  ORF type:complete len:472 (+),score=151.94 GHRR01025247.1:705-2120(+)
MCHGQLLLAVYQASVPLERLLAVARLCITFLTDILRRSDDAQEIPIMILGHHYISHRQLTGAAAPPTASTHTTTAAVAGATTTTSSSAAAAAAAAASGAASSGIDSTIYRAFLQEVCSFDAQEGPKSFVGVEGSPLALLNLQVNPVAVAKSKRLGRELSIKVELAGSSSLGLSEWEEDYVISWPALRFTTPVSPNCQVTIKGELGISCRATGLLLSLAFGNNYSVKGTIEQAQAPSGPSTAATQPLSAQAAAVQGTGNPARGAAGVSGGGGRTLHGKGSLLGLVNGYWTSIISVSCPKLGMEGVLYDASQQLPAALPYIDLAHLGPMRLPRVWSAIHDALLYTDPRMASGGRAATKLALTMHAYLKALTLESAAARDTGSSSEPPRGQLSAAQRAASAGQQAGSVTATRGGSSAGEEVLSTHSALANDLACHLFFTGHCGMMSIHIVVFTAQVPAGPWHAMCVLSQTYKLI